MSHFAVTVVGENPEGQLAPYNEQPEEGSKYLVFNDTTEENKEEYENESQPFVIMPDGERLKPWDEKFRVPGSFGFGGRTHKVPESLEQVDVPHKEEYKDFQEFMYKYHEELPNDDGLYGYMHNPNAKWDWYLLGGRWTGFFKIKDGATHVAKVGEPGLMTKEAEVGYCDQLIKKDIDLEGMQKESASRAAKKWSHVESFFGGSIPTNYTKWQTILNDDSIDDIQQKRDLYWSQPPLKKIQEIRQNEHLYTKEQVDLIGGFYFQLSDYDCGFDEFIKRAIESTFSTFAILYNGHWYEKGEMGWWGMSSNEMSQELWNAKFNELFESLPDDTLLSLYDCHI